MFCKGKTLFTLFSTINDVILRENLLCERLACVYVQTRDMSRIKRRITHPFWWWPQRKHKYMDQELTESNQEFIQEYIKDKYSPAKGDDDALATSPLKEPPWPRGEWTERSQRTGVIARKIGIYPMWTKNGTRLLTTLLQVVDNHVIRYTPPDEFAKERFGAKYKGRYGCLVVGAESADPQLFTAMYNGLFTNAGVQTKRKLCRFLVSPNAALQPGTPLLANHFRVGDYVDVYGKTVGHGFQGVMKRWGMKGGSKTHGNTKSHRRMGAMGGGRNMSRVWPGKKMPGHMGQERRCIYGLKIWRINTKYNVLYVHGPAIPGSTHSFVKVMDCILRKRKQTEPGRPFPTFYAEDSSEPIPEDLYDKELHPFGEPSIIFPEDVVKAKPKRLGAKTAAKR